MSSSTTPAGDQPTGATDQVNDDEIQKIIDQGEAGVGDLITAYEPIERDYFNAVQVGNPTVTYSIDTNPR